MYRSFVIGIISLFFLGCAPKINPNEYHPIIAQKAEILPTQREIKKKPNVIIFNKNNNFYEKKAKEDLENLLINTNYINILTRNSNIKTEIKLAENAKATNSNLNEADFIIIEDITPKTYNEKYTPPKYYTDKKGHTYKIPGYYSYEACSNGYINIYNVIPYQLVKSIYADGCYSTTTSTHQNLKEEIKLNSIKESINNVKENLYKFFTPRGYIFEIRRKDNEYIIHTTLGISNGAEKYAKVNIYTRKIVHIPFSHKKIIEEQKIGEGIISNIVNDNNSWIIVKEIKQPLKIGDYVKMNYKFSLWSILE